MTNVARKVQHFCDMPDKTPLHERFPEFSYFETESLRGPLTKPLPKHLKTTTEQSE